MADADELARILAENERLMAEVEALKTEAALKAETRKAEVSGPGAISQGVGNITGGQGSTVVGGNYYNNSLRALKRMNTMMTKLALIRPKRTAK